MIQFMYYFLYFVAIFSGVALISVLRQLPKILGWSVIVAVLIIAPINAVVTFRSALYPSPPSPYMHMRRRLTFPHFPVRLLLWRMRSKMRYYRPITVKGWLLRRAFLSLLTGRFLQVGVSAMYTYLSLKISG